MQPGAREPDGVAANFYQILFAAGRAPLPECGLSHAGARPIVVVVPNEPTLTAQSLLQYVRLHLIITVLYRLHRILFYRRE
jgi:hypothetical protein